MTKKLTWGAALIPLVGTPLATVVACSSNSATPLARPLYSLDKAAGRLSKFETVEPAIQFLTASENGQPAQNGKQYIVDNVDPLFGNDPNKPAKDGLLSRISHFSAHTSPLNSTSIRVNFTLQPPASTSTNIGELTTETRHFAFEIYGFSLSQNNASVKRIVNAINQNYKDGKHYLIDPKLGNNTPLESHELFKQLTETKDSDLDTLLSYIANFKKVAGFQYEVIDKIANIKSLGFKIKVTKTDEPTETATSELLTFYHPSKSFEEFILKTDLIHPTGNVAISNFSKAISLGENINSGSADVSKQKEAITAYLAKQWKNIEIKPGSADLYTVALSKNRNSSFNKIFGKNWSDVFATTNSHFNNINQIVIGFKIQEFMSNTSADGVATFVFMPQYVQFSWEQDKKPLWVAQSQRVNISSLTENRVELRVKNTATPAKGELVNIK